ncbi:MAG: dethiobiotin synthase [Pseudomonadota bacterium]
MADKRKTFFITGTDTDAGKTLIACGLLKAASAAGYTTIGFKPVAAGAVDTGQGLRNSDALLLQAHSTIQLPYEQVNPVCFPQAIAPHIAAKLNDKRVRVERLAGFCQGVLLKRANLTLIEGAGGWRVPLNEREFLSDLAKQLKVPVILVVPMRLGCLNHALLTAEAITHDGLELAGWVANRMDPDMQCYEENRDTLNLLLDVPLLAEIPFFASAPDPAQIAEFFALDQLMEI